MTVSGPATTPGAVLFARYAYPPNALDLCGPDDASGLWDATVEGTDLAYLSHLATQFEGAWPYLELIARANGIDDPLDARVVQAYWIGNELTRRVPTAVLASSLEQRFARRAGRRFEPLVDAALGGGVAQHSFHVFAVYPWLGLLRSGTTGPSLEVLDRCRIRWGRVESVDGDQALVTSRPLEFVGSKLRLAGPRVEVVQCRRHDAGLVAELHVGDTVSLHWDWVCDVLSPRSQSWLAHSTRRNLDAVNSLASPGPAVACGV